MVNKRVAPRGMGLRRQASQGGLGRMGGYAMGPGGYCYCPVCGTKVRHDIASPCFELACPKCGNKMDRV